jgi:hypothetical protein
VGGQLDLASTPLTVAAYQLPATLSRCDLALVQLVGDRAQGVTPSALALNAPNHG